MFLILLQSIYAIIAPGLAVNNTFGNNLYVFHSAYFWLCLPLTLCVAIAPRYLAKAWKFGFAPDDIDILRWIHKMEPHRNVARDSRLMGGLSALKRPQYAASRASRGESIGDVSFDPRRPSFEQRSASRTDMATGVRSIHRGFDFATEENGVAMRRMQTNLSERRQSSRNLTLPSDGRRRGGSISRVMSLLKRKPPSPKKID